jgi:NAD(P)-dependent dehydrogenase (short-subunit alcohol dehydrogenase family)
MTFGDFPLKGKIAVVTGAGSGINFSFAQHAVQAGARVIVADLKLTEDGEKFMKGEGAKAAVFTKCDVSKRADLENLIKVSEQEFGDVPDVYIAGAGVFEPVGIYVEYEEAMLTGCGSLGQTFGMTQKKMDMLKLTST